MSTYALWSAFRKLGAKFNIGTIKPHGTDRKDKMN